MVDVNRIRERAADWLCDVGDAALGRLNDLVRVVRGREVAFERHGDSDDELRARIKATLARGEPCPGPHQDFEPCDLCADAATDPAGPVDMQRMQDEIAEAAGCVRSAEPGPWRGVEHTVHESRLGSASWIVGPDSGPVMVASFSGLHAEARAREYAALMSAPLPCTAVLLAGQDNDVDNGLWCDRHGGRFVPDAPGPAVNTPAPSRLSGTPAHPKPCGTFRALSAGGMHCGDCGWHVGAHALGKPPAVALWQRWACVGVDGELEVVSVDPCGVAPDVCLATPGSAPVVVRARAADMLGLKEWRFLD